MTEVKTMLGGGQGDGQLLNQDEQFWKENCTQNYMKDVYFEI